MKLSSASKQASSSEVESTALEASNSQWGDSSASEDNEVLAKPISLFSSFITVVSWFAIAVLVFAQCGRWFYISELMGNFQLQLGLAAMVWVALLLIRHRIRSAVALAVVAIWVLSFPLWSCLPAQQPTIENGQKLRVMSYNIYAGNGNQEAIIRSIKQESPDMLLVVEYTPQRAELVDFLNSEFSYSVQEARYHGFGLGLFSRFPIDEYKIHYLSFKPEEIKGHPELRDDPTFEAIISVGKKKIRVLGTHCFNPIEFINYGFRNEQLNKLSKLVAARTDLPTVLVGDFNCTPWSMYFRKFLSESGMRDSRQGFGYQGSWPNGSSVLSIPIDQMLLSPGVRINDRKIGDPGNSDHFPIIGDIVF